MVDMEKGYVGMVKPDPLPIPADAKRYEVSASVRVRPGIGRVLYYSVDIHVPWRGMLVRPNATERRHEDTLKGSFHLRRVAHHLPPAKWLCELAPELEKDGSYFVRKRDGSEQQVLIRDVHAPRLLEIVKVKLARAIEEFRLSVGAAPTAPPPALPPPEPLAATGGGGDTHGLGIGQVDGQVV